MNKHVITTIDDVEKLIKKHYPKGLETARKKSFFNGGSYIGFNLSRYGYTELMAAELHAMRDLLRGREGASYGFAFKPYVQHHKADERSAEDWYEVYTY
jgi:hypothetical protein